MATTSESAAPRRLEYMGLDDVQEAARNPKGHADAGIRASMGRFGYTEPVLLDERTGRLISGHGRIKALRDLRADDGSPPEGISETWEVPVIRGWASRDDAEAEAALLAANQLTIAGGWDNAELLEMLRAQRETEAGLDGLGWTDEAVAQMLAELPEGGASAPAGPSLADRFLVPPFSVLDARQGYWQDRKSQWLALGIRSELGRGGELPKFSEFAKEKGGRKQAAVALHVEPSHVGGGRSGHEKALLLKSPSGRDPRFYLQKQAVEARLGRELSSADFLANYYTSPPEDGGAANLTSSGTSVFDPVICELAYRWFCPPGGAVLDPFAGGSVRGVVAGVLGRSYLGVDLRAEQVAANETQIAAILGESGPDTRPIQYQVGDSAEVVPALAPESFDLVFTCPPYYDLEEYSGDERDLSSMDTDSFDAVYASILAAAGRALRPDRFAVVVTGNVRDRNGAVRDLRASTCRAFAAAGVSLYNDAVLVTMLGSVPVRSGRQFTGSRALGRTHQEVLVFIKGDRRRATEACGEIELDDALAAATAEIDLAGVGQ